MKEAFLVNPAKRRKRRKTKAKRRRNAPKRRRRSPKTVVVRVNAPKRKRRRRTKTRTVVTVNRPKRRRRKSVSKRRRYRRNPPQTALGNIFNLRNFQKNMPFMLTGAVSAIATTMAPGMVSRMFPAPQFPNLVKYGSQIGMTLIGAWAMDTMIPRKGHGTIWLITGGATTMADVIQEFVMPQLGLADYELTNYDLGNDYYESAETLEAFPEADDPYLEAFPSMEEEYAF